VQFVADAYLKAAGWSVCNDIPDDVDKCVIIGAPHTSNWDFIYTLAVANKFGLALRWVGKDSLFEPPFGPIMERLGGISIDRSTSHNYVEAIAAKVRQAREMALVIAPEGTRSKVDRWKSGFYWIAKEADVPIVLGIVDYGRKVAGLAKMIYPIGSPEEVMEQIRDLYHPGMSCHPENYTIPRLSAEGD
jgi:1-acyl-sn-glycerol-3-phosphate acyltransferase